MTMRLATLVATVMTVAAPVLAADPIEGLWRTNQYPNGDSGVVQISACGGQFCGSLIRTYKPTGEAFASKNLGMQILSETVPSGNGNYEGKIHPPGRNQTFNSRLELSGNTLDVFGCKLGVCRRGGTWTRTN